MAKARRRAPKSFTLQERATILEAATRLGAPVAAKQGGCSRKAVERWKKAVADGTDPELARIVAERQQAATVAVGNLFDEVWQETIAELRSRLPGMTNGEVLRAVEQLGDLGIKRDLLKDDDGESDGIPRRDSQPEEGQGRSAPTAGSSAAAQPAIH